MRSPTYITQHAGFERAQKWFNEIHEKTQASGAVQVLYVRHWARRGLTAHELEELRADAPPEQSA